MIVLPKAATGLAEKQRGVIARVQLQRWLRADQVDWLVGKGFLLRIERGVYRVAGGACLPEQSAFAAALRARPAATVTGPFVLGYLGVDGFTTEDPFEILLDPDRRRPQNVGFVCRPDPRPGRPVIKVGEVALAGPLDALAAAGRFRPVLGDRRLRLAYDWLRWRGLIDRDRAADRLNDLAADEEGARQLLALLNGAGGTVSESDGERRLGDVLLQFDPGPEPQVWVTPSRRADWYFRLLRLVIEYLGSVDHDLLSGRLADDERDRELAAEHVRIRYVRREDLLDERQLVASLAATFAARAHELGVPAPVFRGAAGAS